MQDNLLKQTEPEKDRSDSLSGFSVPTQYLYAVAWIPYLTNRDLAGEVSK